MDIVQATQRFEAWLRCQIPVVETDLVYKHEQMRADPFLFFRATFYRWAQLWRKKCAKLSNGPVVVAVGDLHLENFGTWRDTEGRLIWGVNDFDEAHPMAFSNDLVRLAVSTLLSVHVDPAIKLSAVKICAKLLEGYRAALEAGGEPFVLMERHPALRQMATQQLRQPTQFWQRIKSKTSEINDDVPDAVRRSFRKILPRGAKPLYRVLDEPKGLGSLGRRRYLAAADWQGGMIARDAKDVVPSAYLWACGKRAGKGNPWLEKTVHAAVRCADPYYEVRGRWLVRRLGPDCSRIDIEQLKHHEDFSSLLYCMGWETANIHLGNSKARKSIAKALTSLSLDHFEETAQTMFKASLKDWKVFKESKKQKR
jgi:Uncharacterized protein conserved in bacteria (DUF2252)